MAGQPLNELSAFQRDLLVVIASLDEPNGLDAMRELENDYGEDLNHGRLYPALEALEAVGYLENDIESEWENAYHVTDAGESAAFAHVDWIVSRYES